MDNLKIKEGGHGSACWDNVQGSHWKHQERLTDYSEKQDIENFKKLTRQKNVKEA